jgi:hypothetical protein
MEEIILRSGEEMKQGPKSAAETLDDSLYSALCDK